MILKIIKIWYLTSSSFLKKILPRPSIKFLSYYLFLVFFNYFSQAKCQIEGSDLNYFVLKTYILDYCQIKFLFQNWYLNLIQITQYLNIFKF